MKKYLFPIFILFAGAVLAIVPRLVFADDVVELPNPLAVIGVSTPGELVIVVLAGFAGLMGIITIAFIVYNGFKLVVATSEESITSAKTSLTWAVGGFVVALLSFTIISGAGKILGFTPGLIGIANDTLSSPLMFGGEVNKSFIGVLQYVMINFLGLLGFATILMIIYYGYRYVTSAGNEESVEAAKRGLKWAIVGFLVSLLAFTIVTSVRELLVNRSL